MHFYSHVLLCFLFCACFLVSFFVGVWLAKLIMAAEVFREDKTGPLKIAAPATSFHFCFLSRNGRDCNVFGY